MEQALNLAWLALALWMVWLWLRLAPQKSHGRRAQFVALALALAILWPAISVTDDLSIAVLNPAILDSSGYGVRKQHAGPSPHSPATVTLPPPVFAGLSVSVIWTAAPSHPPSPFAHRPALDSIQNRPPPAAA